MADIIPPGRAAPVMAAPPAGGPSTSMLNRMMGPSDLKAGLAGGRDPKEVQKIIYDSSKGSKYFNDQERRNRDVEAKGERLRAKLAEEKLSATGLEAETVERMLEQMEDKRDLSRVIALIDADAFYAACHELEQPELKGTCFGVGGGILTTSSYASRKFGVRSAMPFFIAKKLCPELTVVSMQPELYVKASKQMMAIYSKYGPISPASLDEAYVDLTDYCKNNAVTPSEAISRLRQEVFETTGLTVSAGVSPNKALSKICADVNKPNGQFVIDPTREACMEFMKNVRLRRCFGIGRVTESLLNAIGFESVGDLYTRRADLYLVRNHLGQSATFKWLLSLYLGLGATTVQRAKRGDRKTYGVEKTFRNTDKTAELEETLRRIAKSLAKDLNRAEFAGRTITLKIKHANYETVTRAFTPGRGIWIKSFKDIHRYGLQLLHKEMDDRKAAITRGEKVKGGKAFMLNARLLGLRVSNLRDEREEQKKNNLHGFIQRNETDKGKAKEVDSSDDDSELERDAWDDDTESEQDEQGINSSMQSKLEKMARDALAVPEDDGLAALAEMDAQEQEDARPLPSARWQCPDEEWIINEGLDDRQEPADSDRTLIRMEVRDGVEELILQDSSDDEQPGTSTDHASTWTTKRKAGSSAFDDNKPTGVDKRPKASPPPQQGEVRQCPICARELRGSEIAFTSHVNTCLDAAGKHAKKKHKKPSAPVKTSFSSSIFAGSNAVTCSSRGKHKK